MNLKKTLEKITIILPWIIIGIGVLLRVAVYLQNRNLIVDEANVARNIYERPFGGLFHPLVYEQFAPPLFLVISKICALSIGAYEWSLRLLPFLCSILNLFLFRHLLNKVNLKQAVFYPLFLFATGMIYVRYATEFKQYSSDISVSLSLLLLALYYDLFQTKKLKLFFIWALAGSVAIWLSMPSVFILAGIGAYYFYCAQKENASALLPFLLAAILWLIQFAVYYFMLLKPSLQSDYLQNWHLPNQLILPGFSAQHLQHNADALSTFFGLLGGHWALTFAFHVLLLFIGYFQLWRKHKAIFILTLTPLVLLLIAAALQKFTLLPRVCSFIYPLLLAVIGLGLTHIFSFRWAKYFSIPALVVCIITMINFNELKWINHPPEFDRTTEGFEWISAHAAANAAYYIHNLEEPQKIYYTTIHPDSTRWQNFKQFTPFGILTNMDSLCKTMEEQTVVFYGIVEDDELKMQRQALNTYFHCKDSLIRDNLKVYSFEKRKDH